MSLPLSRRAVLRGLGGIIVGLPFLEALNRSAAAQSPSVPPRRLCLWSWPNGNVIDQWIPQSDANGELTELSPILSPLSRFKRYILPIHGLRLGSALDATSPAVGHPRGAAALFTNSRLAPVEDVTTATTQRTLHPSLDAALADELDPPTRLAALRLQVKDSEGPALFYDARGGVIRPNPNPWEAHRLLFTDTDSRPEQYADIVARRHTVLDGVMEEYRDLRCRLGTEDRRRLEQHLEAIRSVDRRLNHPVRKADRCAHTDLGPERDPLFLSRDENIPEIGRLQMDLLVAALACDATRIACLQWLAPGADALYGWLGMNRPHHAMSHEARIQTDVELTRIYAWYSEQLAYLLAGLQSVVEEEGTTLLDNVTICGASEIALGWNHGIDDCAFIIAGGAGGRLRTGRVVSAEGENHGRLLLALAQAVGATGRAYGDPEYCNGGALDGVLSV